MSDSQKSVSENEYFVTFVQIIKENDKTGELIRKILFMEQDTRLMFIGSFIGKLKNDKYDEELIAAISYLKRQEIVDEIIKIL
jgi:hypothetical protein